MASSAVFSGQGQRLSAWSTGQATPFPEGRPSRGRRSRSSTGKRSTQALAKAGAAADSGPVAALKGVLQPFADLAKDSDAASQGSQLASKLKGGLADGAAKAKGSLPAQDQPQQVSHSFDLSELQDKGVKGLQSAARGLEDALLPPKPPEPPKIPEPTSSVTSGAKSQIASATPADIKSAPGAAGHATNAVQRHNEVTASAAQPQADLSTASFPGADLSDAAGQAQSSLADGVSQAGDSAQSSLTAASDQLSNAASQGALSGSGQASEAASSASDAVSQAQSAASDALGSAQSSLADAYEAATQGSRRITSNLLGNPRQAAAGAQDSVQGAVSDATQSFQEALSGLTRAAQEALAAVQDAASQASTSVNASSGDAVLQAEKAVQGAADVSKAAFTDAAAQANQAAVSLLDALPPEVREAAVAVKGPLQQAFSQIAADSNLRNAAGVAVAVPAFLIWRSRRGGFSGYLSPDAALDLLNKRNAVLIDLRSDEAREADGVPELRFGARGKGAAVAIPTLKRSLTSRSRDGGDLAYIVAAVEIQGLRQVDRRSQIIIMDPSNKTGLKLARALQSQGQARTFILQGGYAAWSAAGLPTKAIAEYGTSALDALTDEAEVLASRTRATVGYLSDPINFVITLILAAGALNTVRDWHNTLQVLGVYGPLISTGLWYRGFDSPQAAADNASKRFSNFVSFFAKLVPKAPPPRPASSQPAAATATAGPTSSTPSSSRLTIPFQQALPETQAKAPTSTPSASDRPSAPAQPRAQPQTQPKPQQQQPQAAPQRAASSAQPVSAQQEDSQESALKAPPAQKASSPPAGKAPSEKAAAEPAALQAANAQAFPSQKAEPASADAGNSQKKSAAQKRQTQQEPGPQANSGSQQKSLGQTKAAEAAVKADTRSVSEK